MFRPASLEWAMQIYDAHVRLEGNVLNVVPKQNLTAAEIMVLRKIHGDDAVVNIQETRVEKRANAAERERLFAVYTGATDEGFNGNNGKRAKIISNLFGPAHLPLPDKLPVVEPPPEVERVETGEDMLN